MSRCRLRPARPHRLYARKAHGLYGSSKCWFALVIVAVGMSALMGALSPRKTVVYMQDKTFAEW